MNVTSNCDVINSAHQIQMNEPSMKIFCVRQCSLRPCADELCLFNATRVTVKGSLTFTMSLSSCPFLWLSCILPAIAYGSSSVNNPIHASYTVNCPYRSCLGRRQMLSMIKQRKRENGETMRVVKTQVTICPYTSLKELSWQDSLLESL